ncbi:MAG: sensor histidine kinase [Parahaliea sp.]
MRLGTGNTKGVTAAPQEGGLFIPDLCATRQVIIIVLLTEMLVLIYTLLESNLPRYSWTLLAEMSVFVQWIVLLSTALLCLLRRFALGLSRFTTTVASLLLVMIVTTLSTVIGHKIYPLSFGGDLTVWGVLRAVLVALAITAIVLRYFYLQHELRKRDLAALQSHLDALRARIRPHFLFNTLNSIASLIETRPAMAESAVVDLAALFRASLSEDDRPGSVADEVRLCKRYLSIESLRLGERLKTVWVVSDAAYGAVMPSLLLQPLVENAVYHGISRLQKGGTIHIAVAVTSGKVQAEVRNQAPATASVGGMRMALENIRLRLQALYGEAAGLRLGGREGEYRVLLHYPYRQARRQESV